MSERHKLLHAILRTDFLSFLQRCFLTVEEGRSFKENWHLEAMAYALMQVKNGDKKRLIVTVPPRHLKSLCVNVAYSA